MKKNRIITFFLVVMSTLTLTGCLEIKDITEEKSDLVAEYAAGVLLRNSDKYEKRLITKEDLEKRGEEATPTSTPIASAEPSTATPAPTGTPSTASDSEPKTSDEPEETEVPTVPLNDVYGLSDINITYKNYMYCEKYKEESSQITAKSGNVLLVTKFDVTNTSGTRQSVKLAEKRITYVLDVDGAQYNPGISILKNMGLNFLSTSIDAGKSEEAIMIFEMSKEKKDAEHISMTVQNGNKIAKITLK